MNAIIKEDTLNRKRGPKKSPVVLYRTKVCLRWLSINHPKELLKHENVKIWRWKNETGMSKGSANLIINNLQTRGEKVGAANFKSLFNKGPGGVEIWKALQGECISMHNSILSAIAASISYFHKCYRLGAPKILRDEVDQHLNDLLNQQTYINPSELLSVLVDQIRWMEQEGILVPNQPYDTYSFYLGDDEDGKKRFEKEIALKWLEKTANEGPGGVGALLWKSVKPDGEPITDYDPNEFEPIVQNDN